MSIVLDRLSKIWAVGALPMGTQDGPNLGIVRLTMVHNEGAAFSIGEGHPMVFVVIALVFLACILVYMLKIKEHSTFDIVAMGLIAGGAVGNMIDRVMWGYVVDYFDFTFISFPVFNVADCCVVVGVVLFIIHIFFFMDYGEEDASASEKKGK